MTLDELREEIRIELDMMGSHCSESAFPSRRS